MEQQRCLSCGELKSQEQFSFCDKQKTRRKPKCKECEKELRRLRERSSGGKVPTQNDNPMPPNVQHEDVERVARAIELLFQIDSRSQKMP